MARIVGAGSIVVFGRLVALLIWVSRRSSQPVSNQLHASNAKIRDLNAFINSAGI